ncbi:pyridoxine/pyridoxamine 5'-phosphate oxidase [Frigoribacterium sp. 2-23]|uniref:pyridoxine/pyridoxamine 5'-phosphate oxidase n=1 Tax=Frigoribacterium sp. 2-23 TaxID=3415006 RepID=UPI003C6FED24
MTPDEHDDSALQNGDDNDGSAADARPESVRERLRSAARPDPDVPALDASAPPRDPIALFTEWLFAAVDAGIPQPQAMTLSTSSATGEVTARTLLLKDVDEAFWFATSSLSPKGRQIAENPRVGLTFFWSALGRQVRVEGRAEEGPDDARRADFLARHPDTRAAAIAVPQSERVDVEAPATRARVDEARREIDRDPDLVPDDWAVYRVVPSMIEFWQATTGRDQVRVRYDAAPGGGWRHAALWP